MNSFTLNIFHHKKVNLIEHLEIMRKALNLSILNY